MQKLIAVGHFETGIVVLTLDSRTRRSLIVNGHVVQIEVDLAVDTHLPSYSIIIFFGFLLLSPQRRAPARGEFELA